MINKELLSEVFGKDVLWLEFTSEYGFDAIEYEVKDETQRGNRFQDIINIHELAYKCKKWALNQDIVIFSFIDHCGDAFARLSSGVLPKIGGTYCADTEPEAIFKACEWILEQKATS